jgi:Tol biopolymer transport system component
MRRRRVIVVVAASIAFGLASLGEPVQASFAGQSAARVNGKIAYSNYHSDTDTSSVVTIDPDGSDAHPVGTGDVSCGGWAPDGSKIAVCVFPDGFARPAVANPDGSGLTILDKYPNLQLWLPCSYWTPDETRLLCNANTVGDPSGFGLYTVRSSDGGGLHRVVATPPGYQDFALGYSPDGSRILFFREDDTFTKVLFDVRADGTGLRRLSPDGMSELDLDFFDGAGASWSPDARRVTFAAYSTTSHTFDSGVFVVNRDGSGLHRVTPMGFGALSAQWSPAGNRIAFSSCCGNLEAWTVRPDGSDLRRVTHLTDGTNVFAPVWSPDGSQLLFQEQHSGGSVDLWTSRSDGSELSELAPSTDLTSYAWGTAPAG